MHLYRGTSPGKKLFQITVTDQHGLTLKHSKLAYRSLIAFAPMWIVGLKYILTGDRRAAIEFGPGATPAPTDHNFVMTLTVVLMVVWAVDVAMAFFGKRRLAWHDRLFDSRVVLNATDSKRPRTHGKTRFIPQTT